MLLCPNCREWAVTILHDPEEDEDVDNTIEKCMECGWSNVNSQ